jgi:acyl carrier protein
MEIEKIITDIVMENILISEDIVKRKKLDELGVTSIKLLQIIILICNSLKIDLMNLDNKYVTTSRTINELIIYFKNLKVEI